METHHNPDSPSRRDFIDFGTKLLVLASVGATFEQITGAEPAPDNYKVAEHWWGVFGS